MLEFVVPFLYCLLLWWFGTGLVLYLDGLSERTYRTSMLLAAVAAMAAFVILLWFASSTTPAAAFIGFTCAIVIWGALELAHYTGYLVGPRTEKCPAGAATLERLSLAAKSMLFHEIAMVVTAGILVVSAWGQPNQVGVGSFLILWLMRLSAEFNLFLGVANVSEHWLPDRLRYLMSYRGRKKMNLLLPVSVTLATVVAVLMFQRATGDAFAVTGYVLMATLLMLAVIEHWLMVIPIDAEAIWSWAVQSRPQADRRDDVTISQNPKKEVQHGLSTIL